MIGLGRTQQDEPVMLRYLPKDGNSFGVVKVRAEICSIFHTPLHTHVKSGTPTTNVRGRKCFGRSGLKPELRLMGNHSKTIYRDAP